MDRRAIVVMMLVAMMFAGISFPGHTFATQSTPTSPEVSPAASGFDATNIELIWQTFGGEPTFQFPTTMTIAPDGKVYVVNANYNHIQIFCPDGEYLETWGGNAQFKFHQDLGYFGDVDFDAGGNIYVFDSFNNRI